MPRLLHGLGQRNSTVGGLGKIPLPQSMRRKLSRVQSSQFCALLDDVVDRFWIEGATRDISPAVDLPKHAAGVNLCGLEPGVQRFDGPAGQEHDPVLVYVRRLGAAQMDRSEERRVGKECVSTCRSRWSTNNKKKK